MKFILVLQFLGSLFCLSLHVAAALEIKSNDVNVPNTALSKSIPCTCGVFLTGQFVKGNPAPPKGNPVILHEYNEAYVCNSLGQKQCANRCLEVLVRHLPNSPSIICGAIDRDCHKERVYLFVKNCVDKWVNTNLSTGREYCCKNNVPYKCPIFQ